MTKFFSKFKHFHLKIDTIVTVVFFGSVGLAYLGVLKPIQAYHLTVFTLLCVFAYLLYKLVKNKCIFINSRKFLLSSLVGLFILFCYLAMIFLSINILSDGLLSR
jgi:hypothetical protein